MWEQKKCKCVKHLAPEGTAPSNKLPQHQLALTDYTLKNDLRVQGLKDVSQPGFCSPLLISAGRWRLEATLATTGIIYPYLRVNCGRTSCIVGKF